MNTKHALLIAILLPLPAAAMVNPRHFSTAYGSRHEPLKKNVGYVAAYALKESAKL